MATTEEEDVPPPTQTVADQLGHVWEEVISLPEKAQDIVTARRGGTLWPLLLIGAAMAALLVGGGVATVLGALALIALAVWVTAMEVRH